MTRLLACLTLGFLAYPAFAFEEPVEATVQQAASIQLDAKHIHALRAGEPILVQMVTPSGQTIIVRVLGNDAASLPTAAPKVPASPPLPDATIVILPPEPVLAGPPSDPLLEAVAAAAAIPPSRTSQFAPPALPRPDESIISEAIDGDYVLPAAVPGLVPASTEITQGELEGTARIPLDNGNVPAGITELPPYVPSEFPLSEPGVTDASLAPIIPDEIAAISVADEVPAGFSSAPSVSAEPVIAPIQPATLAPLEKGTAEASRPWLPLVLATLALLASVGGNLYLGYLCGGLYRRQRTMLDDSAEESAPASEQDVSPKMPAADEQAAD